jgi:hypothetical protein
MLAGYDFEEDELRTRAKGTSELQRIDALFRRMRDTVKRECLSTREMLSERLGRLEELVAEEYRKLYESADQEIRDEIERMWHPGSRDRDAGEEGPDAPDDDVLPRDQNYESEIMFGYNEEEEVEDIFAAC